MRKWRKFYPAFHNALILYASRLPLKSKIMFVVLVEVQVEAVTAMIGLGSTLRTPSQAIITIIATAIIIEDKLMLLEEEELRLAVKMFMDK